ncbi:phage protein NinX family protein [Erwinia aphidicola]|uniref:phage protein NinX family protein n=1 Tax=Erwinia aphidicola TaxID=68334 RepID=UPI0030CD16B5
MDYSKLSDQEIAANVLIAQGYKLIDDAYGYSIYISDSGRKDTGPKASKQFAFDPCNNAADAWPIILSNRITLMPASKGDKWIAQVFDHAIADVSTNPLRSAMIVYLMMQESE